MKGGGEFGEGWNGGKGQKILDDPGATGYFCQSFGKACSRLLCYEITVPEDKNTKISPNPSLSKRGIPAFEKERAGGTRDTQISDTGKRDD